MNTLLQQGVAAAQAGRREEARQVLIQAVEADERNEHAWLWLARLVDDPDDIQTCLENVLALNSGHDEAQKELARLQERRSSDMDGQNQLVSAAGQSENKQEVTAPATVIAVSETLSSPQASPTDAGVRCVYCGADVAATQEHCVHCQKSLLIRVPGTEKRSVELALLAILSGIGSVLTIIAGGLMLIGGLLFSTAGETLKQQPELLSGEAQQFATDTALPPGIDMYSLIDLVGSIIYGIALALIVGGCLYLLVTRGLWQRQRWAYIAAVAFSILGGLSAGLPVVFAIIVGNISLSTVLGVVVQVVLFALTVASYRDFFGPKVRLVPDVGQTHAIGHYNNGLAYKKRGMWYMVTKEWEAAVRQAPTELKYLHALGLAYAQLQQFDQARTVFNQALSISPDDTQLRDSRALIERMATGHNT